METSEKAPSTLGLELPKGIPLKLQFISLVSDQSHPPVVLCSLGRID
jgi:hypothetical protein